MGKGRKELGRIKEEGYIRPVYIGFEEWIKKVTNGFPAKLHRYIIIRIVPFRDQKEKGTFQGYVLK